VRFSRVALPSLLVTCLLGAATMSWSRTAANEGGERATISAPLPAVVGAAAVFTPTSPRAAAPNLEFAVLGVAATLAAAIALGAIRRTRAALVPLQIRAGMRVRGPPLLTGSSGLAL
jgi:hypothetical protein